jgi:Ser-tRNA(Ala) deacylase AlaX
MTRGRTTTDLNSQRAHEPVIEELIAATEALLRADHRSSDGYYIPNREAIQRRAEVAIEAAQQPASV